MRRKIPAALGCLLSLAATSPSAGVIEEFPSYCGRGAALWGKSLCGPILLVDPQSRAAIGNFDPKVAVFARRGAYWIGTLPSTIPLANTSVELAGERVAEVLLPLPDDPIDRRILLAHESFHRIQPDLGFQLQEAENRQLDSKDGRINARLEIAALRAALTRKDWRPAARDALAFRAKRLAEFPAAAASETNLINNEGVAEYTGIRVGAQGQEVAFALRRLDSGALRPSLVRSFGYVVGPAYGLLLDRGLADWRKAVLTGRALPDVLGERIRPNYPGVDPAKYGGAAIISEETIRDAGIQKRRMVLVAKLVAGPTVTFPFEAMQIAFNPNMLFSLGDEGTVYSSAVTVRDKWGTLEATGDVLLSPSRTFARVPGPAVASGNKVSGPGWHAELREEYRLVEDGLNRQVIKLLSTL